MSNGDIKETQRATADGIASEDAAATAGIGSRSEAGSAAPQLIGHYRLIRSLGEGGMGQVWLAEQTSPVKRQVALKLIKGGWYDAEVIQRFESERQSLAVMDHPAIAKVFDAGTTPEGKPFFVMEYVAGLPVTRYCDQHKLTTRERIELFIRICEGVQHAHQKSIIHRDLKPSNILVAEIDGVAAPRIIDFGIAKATLQEEDADQTVLTRMGALIGTPDYMSPEQSDPSAVDIDSRTDVYSLGVVLYEMLTGCLPFGSQTQQKRGLEEILRQLREDDPPTPSTRLKKEPGTSTIFAEMQRTTRKQLISQLRGDLDCIAMKALEKDRARRYATPSELAADLRRYLADEPIMARPPSVTYQLGKFTRRNRILVGGLLAVFIVLIAGATASTILAIRATRAQRLAEQRRVQTEQARTVAVQREKEAIASQKLAVQRETEAEAARKAEAQQRKAAEHSAEEARKQTAVAEKNFQMARNAVDKYFTDVSESRELKAHNLETLRHNLLLTARDFYQQFVKERASDNFLRADLGGNLERLGQADEQIGDNVQAEDSLLQAKSILEASFREHPENEVIVENLSLSYQSLGLLYASLGKFDQAQASDKQDVSLLEQWSKTHPPRNVDSQMLATEYDNLGVAQDRVGDVRDGLESFRKGSALQQELVKENPDNDGYKIDLVLADVNMAEVLAAANQTAAALPYAKESVAIGETLYAKDPGNPDVLNRLGASYNNLGGIYTLSGRIDEAEKAHHRAMELREKLASEHPAIVEYNFYLAGSYINLGELAERENHPADALEWLKKGANTLFGVLAKQPRQSTARAYLSYDYSWQARAYDTQGNREAAAKAWQQAIENDDHNDPELRFGRALALADLGEAAAATAMADKLAAANPGGDAEFELARVYALSAATVSKENAALADTYAAKSVDLLNRAAAAGYFRVAEQLEQLKSNPQLAAIRERNDYKELMRKVNLGK